MSPRVAAIVLAAGASTRMGRPKALLERGGVTFLRALLDLADGAGCDPRIVVAGAVALPAAECRGAIVLVNETWPLGQLSSLQVGLGALTSPASTSGALILTVDRPHLAATTLAALVDAHRRWPMAILQPMFQGRRGHPILYPADLFPAIRAIDPTLGPRAWLTSPPIDGRRREIEVDDPAILDNVDTPADLEQLDRRGPR